MIHQVAASISDSTFCQITLVHVVDAVLDEATSQVDVAMEWLLYTTCCQLNITLLSVGHRDSLRQFHQLELRIGPAGRWQMLPLHSVTASDLVAVDNESL